MLGTRVWKLIKRYGFQGEHLEENTEERGDKHIKSDGIKSNKFINADREEGRRGFGGRCS